MNGNFFLNVMVLSTFGGVNDKYEKKVGFMYLSL
jgi:hypothetical protein